MPGWWPPSTHQGRTAPTALGALVVLVLTARGHAAAPPPQPPQLRVAVSELFRDMFSTPDSCEPNRTAAPWLGSAELRGTWNRTLLPPVRALNDTILSAPYLFRPDRRVCAGSADLPPADAAPAGFCVNTAWDGTLFDQYAMERHVLSRVLQRTTLVCGGGARSLAELSARAAADPSWCDADVVYVPSLRFHHFAIGGDGWVAWRGCLVRSLFVRYWEAVEMLYHARARPGGRARLVVVVDPHSWNSHVQLKNLRSMGERTSGFLSRLVLGVSMSSLPTADRHWIFGTTRAAADWRDGAEEELARRERLLEHARGARKQLRSFCGGPLFATLPMVVGMDHAADWSARSGAFDPAARRPIALLYDADSRRDGMDRLAGMQHTRPVVRRALARHGASACRHRSFGTMVICRERGLRNCSQFCSTLYGRLARAEFVIEPPGDVLGRSHAYAAMAAGAIPVLLEGGHDAYDSSAPTWWAWRAARAAHAGGARAGRGTRARRRLLASRAPVLSAAGTVALDYSRFAVFIRAAEIARDSHAYWMRWLLELSNDRRLLARMRAEMQRAMPFFTYAPHDCRGAADGAVCDAVSAFDAVVRRAWLASSQLMPPRLPYHFWRERSVCTRPSARFAAEGPMINYTTLLGTPKLQRRHLPKLMFT